MNETTCAACDCKIEGEAIKVKIGGKAVEVCCEECAQRLREARVSAEENRSRNCRNSELLDSGFFLGVLAILARDIFSLVSAPQRPVRH